MAGAGYKLFNTGDVLTAAQVNTYLNEQTVMVFASSAARTSALSGVLAEGMVSYLQDTNSVEVYNGTAWVGVSGAGDVTEVQAGVGISVASGTGPIPVITNSSTDLITTAGDLLYGTAADTVARLGIGTAGQVLKVNSGATAPEWGAAPSASFVGCLLTKSASQNITTATATAVTFNQETYDTNSFHDNATNNSRVTIPSGKGGYYAINANVTFDSSATTGNYHLYILKNGGGNGLAGSLQAVNRPAIGVVNTVVNLTAGDYIELIIYQNTGGTGPTLHDPSQGFTYFQVNFLGA